MDKTVKGIVLKSRDYGEADKLVTLLTLEEGKLTVVAKSVKKVRSKLKFATQPFCFGEFELVFSKGLPIMSGCEIIEPFFELSADIEKFYLASAILEVLDVISEENTESAKELVFAVNCMKRIAVESEALSALSIKLICEIMATAGFGLDLSACINCGEKIEYEAYFDPENGGFLCKNCQEGRRSINVKTYKILQIATNTEDAKLKNLLFTNADYALCLKFLHRYMEYKLYFKNNSLSEYVKLL